MKLTIFKSRPARTLAIAAFVIAAMGVALVWSRFDRVNEVRALQSRSIPIQMTSVFTLGKERPFFRADDPVGAILPLESLGLTFATAADLAGLAKFPELRRLYLSQANLDDHSLKVLKSLPNLETIAFECLDGVTDEGLKNLRFCARLKVIVVAFAPGITGSFLESLRDNVELSELEIHDCYDFESSSLDSLRLFPGLRTVSVTHCYLDGSGFEVFQELKNLKRVEIDLPDKSLRKYFAHIPDTSFLERKVTPNPEM